MKNKTQKVQTAQELINDDDHYTAVGARSMVESGRGHWQIDPSWLRRSFSRLWRNPDGDNSLGTTPTGKIYGEE